MTAILRVRVPRPLPCQLGAVHVMDLSTTLHYLPPCKLTAETGGMAWPGSGSGRRQPALGKSRAFVQHGRVQDAWDPVLARLLGQKVDEPCACLPPHERDLAVADSAQLADNRERAVSVGQVGLRLHGHWRACRRFGLLGAALCRKDL